MCFRAEYGTLSLMRSHEGASQKVEPKPTILILAMPGDLQTSLQMLLSLLSDVAVLVTEAGYSALQAIEGYSPALVIFDFALNGGDPQMIVDMIKVRWPTIPCLVLVNDAQQRQKAQDTGADLVLVKGYPAAKLLAAVENLLSQSEKVKGDKS